MYGVTNAMVLEHLCFMGFFSSKRFVLLFSMLLKKIKSPHAFGTHHVYLILIFSHFTMDYKTLS